MTEKEKFVISEAKDLLKDLNAAISKTRDKSWQLLAFVIAIDVYLLKCFLETTNVTHSIIAISIIFLIGSFPIGIFLSKSLFPVGLRQNGAAPKKSEKLLLPENDDIYFRVLSKSYQENIDLNNPILSEMVSNYKKALQAICLLIVLALFVFLLIMFIEGR